MGGSLAELSAGVGGKDTALSTGLPILTAAVHWPTVEWCYLATYFAAAM